ncbi:putative acyl-activating enzyme 1 [Quercus suber]|uniref:Acyl-activating enzyme 1 n=1 Tax=Quercus suber TaxID=58331 RepID=A0AAW0JK19_QUESU
MEGVIQCSANFVPLTPIGFLDRAAIVYGDEVSMVYGTEKTTWGETHERCIKLASALVQLGISRGDIVAAFAPNVPALYELHFGVPMAGAVISALNTKLDSTMLALLLEQLEAKIIFAYHEFLEVVLGALNIISEREGKPPPLVLIAECDKKSFSIVEATPPGSLDYNDLLAMGQADFEIIRPKNECDPISVNYTSGSTGIPKGAIYSHRAAYLNSIATIFRINVREKLVFLWTVDMFRCNGWCFPWAVAALGGSNICLRMEIIVAGPLPPPQVVTKVIELGFNVSHGYGMTEALGPAIVTPCTPELQYSSTLDEQAKTKRLEGLHNLIMDGVDVKDPSTMKSIAHDGKTIGEVMFKGNTMMLGYFKKPKVTQEAFRGGWYRTGDLAIRHQDGFIEMKDRAKDMIICGGGEIVSSLEVEVVLLSHPKVFEAAVVGTNKPCAFVKLKEGCDNCVPEEIIEFCGERLPKYMVPHSVVFGDLPVNSTGKIQKFVLREKAKTMGMQNGSLK